MTHISKLHRSMLLIALGAIVIAATGETLYAAATPAPKRPSAKLTLPFSGPGSIVLKNNGSDSLRIEVRAGQSLNCSANALVDTRVLPQGRSWLISSDQPLCWRSSRASVNAWSAWARGIVAPGVRTNVSL